PGAPPPAHRPSASTEGAHPGRDAVPDQRRRLPPSARCPLRRRPPRPRRQHRPRGGPRLHLGAHPADPRPLPDRGGVLMALAKDLSHLPKPATPKAVAWKPDPEPRFVHLLAE